MRLSTLLALLLFAASGAVAQNAPPETFFGEFVPTEATTTLPATNGALTARNAFLADLDPASISFFDFEGLTPTYTANTGRPPRGAPGTLVDRALALFDGYGDTAQIPARVFARSSQIANMDGRNPRAIDGGWATSGDQYLYAVGYDLGGAAPTQTSVAVSIRYDPTATTAGRTARPFSAFGGYVIDTEGYENIRLTLTPLGGGTPVVIDYGPVDNDNGGADDPRGDFPGNYQVAFIGFTDHDTQYERIDISFEDRDQSTVADESFAFDDFVVGELNQVNGPEVTPETDRVLNQVDEPGWRLLSAPVRGVTVDDLAQQNLVQGVAAGATTPAQYPTAGSNFYWQYGGGTRWDYIPVPATDTVLRPGRGFWWYWYDLELTPDPNGAGGGTSESVELDFFQLSGEGPPLTGTFSESFVDNTNCSSDPNEPCPGGRTRNGEPPPQVELPTGTQTPRNPHTPEDDDYYMIGNPFSYPMDFSAVTASGGTLAAQGVIWNPDNQSGTFPRTNEDIAFDGPGTYEVVFETPPSGEQGAVAVWNGVLVEVTKTAGQIGQPVVFTFDPTVAVTAETPLFHGKTAGAEEAYIRFGLFGETASGAKTRDEIAYLRFAEGAQFGWDRMDASKPAWPGGPVGLVGLKSTRGRAGTASREIVAQAVKALPPQAIQRRSTVMLKTSEAGTYELVWKSLGLTGHLQDLETGEKIPLSAERYVFTSEGTGEDWADRFFLRTFPLQSDANAKTASATTSDTFIGMPSPNPTRGSFSLDVATSTETTVFVYDALGRQVSETIVSGSEAGQTVRVSTDGFAPGAYLVVVEAQGVRETRRVTVLR